MKTVVIVFLAVLAMSYAGRVNVVDNTGSDGAYYRPSQGPNGNNRPILDNPDPAFYQPSNGGGINIANPDPAFYQPSNGVNVVNPSGYQKPSFGPEFVNFQPQQQPYPYIPYRDPNLRNGN